MSDVANSMNLVGKEISDDPFEIKNCLKDVFKKPMLLNINTHRKFWHSGAGIDDPDTFDRYEEEMSLIGEEAKKIHDETKEKVEKIWKTQLERQ